MSKKNATQMKCKKITFKILSFFKGLYAHSYIVCLLKHFPLAFLLRALIKSSQKKYSIQKMFEQKNNVTNVHGTKVLNNEKIYKNYLKCSIIFFLLSDYEKWCHNRQWSF